ncbi:MAG TPA: YhcH/YjgK/YiaL family protein [Puia sp.]|nr:YhcH/YjgK/YiaL family protein [Puia sp.]
MEHPLMKFIGLFGIFSLFAIVVYAQSSKDKEMKKAAAWVAKGEWKKGLTVKPHASINPLEFEKQYHSNQQTWDKAFEFLNRKDLAGLAVGKYPIDGDKAYALISEYESKDLDKTQWESHRKYIDLQYVISGKEKIGVLPLAKAVVTEAYDESKDIAHYSSDAGTYYVAEPGTFFLFFPQDAHRPGNRDGNSIHVRKMVIKIAYAD